ncbi:MAG: PAS domain-containing protein, partial [Cytophagales bacterium]|nr:PAS domain-containing protein [Cytophagales bacterium]
MKKLLLEQLSKQFGKKDEWPKEINELYQNLEQDYQNFQQQIQTLSGEVEQCTNELVLLHEKLKTETDELKHTYQDMERVFNNVGHGFYSVDIPNRQCFYVSKACEDIFGHPVAAFYADPNLWYDIVLPEDKPLVDFNQDQLAAGKAIKQQFRIQNQENGIRWLESIIIPVMDARDQLIRLDGVVTDITERKHNELALAEKQDQIQAIFDASLDAVLIINVQGKIVKWDQKCMQLFGWTEDEVLYKPMADILIPEDYRAAHKNGLKRYLQTGATNILNKALDFQALNKAGNLIDVSVSITSTQLMGHQVFIGFIRDITHRKQSENQLKLAHNEVNRILSNVDQVIFSLDFSTYQFRHISQSCKKVYGYSVEEF